MDLFTSPKTLSLCHLLESWLFVEENGLVKSGTTVAGWWSRSTEDLQNTSCLLESWKNYRGRNTLQNDEGG